MRCQLSRDYHFEAAHRLPRVPATHKCSRVHGHSYHVTVTLSGSIDADMGWLVDLADIDRVIDPVITRLDHTLLNEIPGLENPTSELLAVWLWREIQPRLPGLTEVMVAETPTSRCVYRGD
jgi:6-pyruvoyltetrahydropterin/6-carboxytetrahydropterin synthase